MKRRGRAVDGVLLLDKPYGVTSNAALQTCRRLLNAQKAGHTGTLDPLASGLLALTFGEATKFSADLLHADKTYIAGVKLGQKTNTGDLEGQFIESRPVNVTREDIEKVLEHFRGEIKQIHGKGNEDFFRAPHATIYPDKMVVDQGGETTRCPAVEHSPCLLIKADTFEIYPHDKMVAHNVKVYVKGKHVYSRDTWVNELGDDGGTRIMPSIGYDGDDDKGAYIKLKLDYDIDENTNVHAELPYYNRGHFKPIFQAKHDQRNYYITYQSGWEEEDDEWVNKKNEIGFYYKPHYFIDGIPVTYRLYAHRGLWENDETGRQSWHTEYGAYLTHDRIYLFDSKKTFLDLTIGKKWVNESYTDETRSTMMYYGTLGQKLGDKWNTWVGYYREKVTSDLYDLGQPDMERELRNGLSYKPDDRNTFSIINRYDTGKHENYETIYSWTHRFCCWAITFEYEHAQNEDEDTQWNIRYEFLNW